MSHVLGLLDPLLGFLGPSERGRLHERPPEAEDVGMEGEQTAGSSLYARVGKLRPREEEGLFEWTER